MLPHLLACVASLGCSNNSVAGVRSPAFRTNKLKIDLVVHSPNKRGCDIGYALTANSCEEASCVDTCTVATPDAITAFAVPSPSCSSQSSRFFRVGLPSGLPRQADRPAYFGLASIT